MGKSIGIDLGTNNTVVTYENKKGNLVSLKIKGASSRDVIPSVLFFKSEDEWVIGKEAVDLAPLYPQAVIRQFKSHLDDSKYKYAIIAENGDEFKITSRKAVTFFLNKLIKGIEDKLVKEFGTVDGIIEKVVITVPAKFNSSQKELTRKAAENAGFDVVKLAPEPAAAAIAYQKGQEIDEDITVLVYDFGGGTFDISVMQKNQGKYVEIETNGDKELGGNNLTNYIVEDFLVKIASIINLDMPLDEDEFDEDDCGISFKDYKKNMEQIIDAANNAKEELSAVLTTNVVIPLKVVDGANKNVSFEYSRKEIEQLISRDIRHTIALTENTVNAVKDRGIKIDKIVLAGGTSNIPLIHDLIKDAFPEYFVNADEDYSTLISRGAALLSKGIEEEMSGITNSQLGVSYIDGVIYNKFKMIVPENSELPCSGSHVFGIAHDNQRQLSISYYDYDVKNYPNKIRIDEKGISLIDSLIVSLPAGLKKDNTEVEVFFNCMLDGSIDIKVEVRDKNGKQLVEKDISYVKESQLE